MLKDKKIRIANGQGFWGDSPQAPIDLVNSAKIDYLTMDYLAEVTLSIMQKQKNGSIINISTFAVFEPEKYFPTSGVFRASLSSFTKIFSDEYASHNIRMNNVLPGFIDSLNTKKEFINRVPLKRVGKVKEISAVISMLASKDGSYITGQNIRVDGGITRSV